MQASTVSSSQTRSTRSTSALLALLLSGAVLTGLSNPASADDGRVVLSTGLGAVAGALIGQSIGGRDATIVGGVLGAAIGASAATQGGNYRNGPPPAYYQPAQVYRPAPVVYQPVYQPVYRANYRPYVRPVVYPVYYRGGHDGGYDSDGRRGHDRYDGRGWEHGGHGGDGRRDGDRRR